MPVIEPGIGQGSLFVPEVYKAPDLPPDFDPSKRTSFSHLICVVSDHLDLPPDYTTIADLSRLDPSSIDPGLCVGTVEARGSDAKNLYMGIGFTATQFLELARSPRDLGNHTYSRALKANTKREEEVRLDRDQAFATASRAAGHALEDRVIRIDVLIGQISEQLLVLRALYSELKSPGRAHWSGANLDRMRRAASDIIHSDIEIAAVTLDWRDATAEGLQRALHYNLYGHRGHNNTRLKFWSRYVSMAGRHAKRQLAASRVSLRKTHEELSKYQPFLEASDLVV